MNLFDVEWAETRDGGGGRLRQHRRRLLRWGRGKQRHEEAPETTGEVKFTTELTTGADHGG